MVRSRYKTPRMLVLLTVMTALLLLLVALRYQWLGQVSEGASAPSPSAGATEFGDNSAPEFIRAFLNLHTEYSGTTLDAYGDSITVGYGARLPYPTQIGTATGWLVTNHAVNGAQMADQAARVYETTISPSGNYSLLVGPNDSGNYGANAAKQTIFQEGLAALLGYLAIPTGQKVPGSDTAHIAYSANWSASELYGIGRKSSTRGAAATAKVYGDVVYVAVSVKDGNAGTFHLAIDGVTIGKYNCFGSAKILTINGFAYAPKLIRVGGLSKFTHSVVLTVNSATGAGNVVYLDWVAGINRGSQTAWPTVYSLTLPRESLAKYKSLGTTEATQTAPYTRFVKQQAQKLQADGLNVVLVDFAPYVNQGSDLQADGVHPTDIGLAHIKDAVLALAKRQRQTWRVRSW